MIRLNGMKWSAIVVACVVVAGSGCQSPGRPDEPNVDLQMKGGDPVVQTDEQDESASNSASYTQMVDEFHRERVATLQSEYGWLTLVTLAWLEPGENSIGRDQTHRVSHPGLPVERIGSIQWTRGSGAGEQDRLVFAPDAGAAGVLLGVPDNRILLSDADDGGPTELSAGDCRFYVIKRGDGYAVRMKDPKADRRTSFTGLSRFPVDAAWRVTADFTPAATNVVTTVDSIIGVSTEEQVAGYASFMHGEQPVRMTLLATSDPDRYFIVFGDETNGGKTYDAGRFVAAERGTSPDQVIIDFNRAVNPPCAFTPYATCPLPPDGNRLSFAVTAGEMRPPDQLDHADHE